MREMCSWKRTEEGEQQYNGMDKLPHGLDTRKMATPCKAYKVINRYNTISLVS